LYGKTNLQLFLSMPGAYKEKHN